MPDKNRQRGGAPAAAGMQPGDTDKKISAIAFERVRSSSRPAQQPAAAAGALAGVKEFFKRMVTALHESRQRQAEQIVQRYGHLIPDEHLEYLDELDREAEARRKKQRR